MKISKKASRISPSATLAITSKAKKMKKAGIDVMSFAAGEPDFDTPEEAKTAAIESIRKGFTKYTPAGGTDELKQAICRKFREDNGLEYAPEQIIISCGAKHSLYNVFQVLCDEGDEVVIIIPYWLSYPEMISLAGGKSVFLTTNASDGFKPSLKDLKAKITKRTVAIILNSPSNPAGIVYNRKELEEIADIAVSRKVAVVSDEIYEKIIFDNEKHISIGSLGRDIYDLTVTVNGVSKTYSMTGWRIGYMGAKQEISKAIGALQSHSTSNPTSISQAAALVALGIDKSYAEENRKMFEKRRDALLSRLDKVDRISYVKPKGAFYVFCDISKTGMDADDFAAGLLEREKVAVIPGASFGCKDWIRLSFATNIDNINKGVDRIEKYIKSL